MAYVNNIQALALATLAVFMTNAQEQRNHIRTDVMLDSYGLSRSPRWAVRGAFPACHE